MGASCDVDQGATAPEDEGPHASAEGEDRQTYIFIQKTLKSRGRAAPLRGALLFNEKYEYFYSSAGVLALFKENAAFSQLSIIFFVVF